MVTYNKETRLKDFTDISVLVDRSGSMQSIARDMEGGFSTFLKEHQKVPSTRLTLIQFDDANDNEVVYEARPIKKATRLIIQPRGNTPLLDAMCKAIDRTGARLAAMPENDRPARVLMVIITDGEENSSKIYKRSDVFNRIGTQRDVYKWNFIYLGARQDAIAEAATFNIPMINTMTYTPSTVGTRNMMASLSGTTVAYTSTGSLNAFTSADIQNAMDPSNTSTE